MEGLLFRDKSPDVGLYGLGCIVHDNGFMFYGLGFGFYAHFPFRF